MTVAPSAHIRKTPKFGSPNRVLAMSATAPAS